MTHVNPANRLSAYQCLQHPFFSDSHQNEITVNSGLDKVGKFEKKKDEKPNSFFVNSGVINGQINTVNDCGSKAGMVSIKKVDKFNKKPNNKPRASIYKTVLDRKAQNQLESLV